MSMLVDYIRNYIDIAIDLKIENALTQSQPHKSPQDEEIQKYENYINKLEEEIRNHVKVFFIYSD
jgi:hypothetical protein